MDTRTVSVAPERLPGWVDRFVQRHGEVTADVDADGVVLTAPDGAQAQWPIGWGGLPSEAPHTLDASYAHLAANRRVAVLLARRAAHAVGVFHGQDLVASKVDTHYVQGRTKAGGWSQQRYARRRSNQADHAAAGAAKDVQRIIVAEPDRWDWFVTGGDAAAVAAVLALTPRLADHAPSRVLPTPDPRLAVLQSFPEQYRAVSIQLNALA